MSISRLATRDSRLSLSVVLPCYNEGPGLPALLEAYRLAAPRGLRWELVLVLNGCTDGSEAVLASLLKQKRYAFARRLTLAVNQGYGAGLAAGLREARGKALAYSHADGQCRPQDVFAAWRALDAAGPAARLLVKGRRQPRAFSAELLTAAMGLWASLWLGHRLRDINAQPKAFAAALLPSLEPLPPGFEFDAAVLARALDAGCRIELLDAPYGPRAQGESKWAAHWLSRWRTMLKVALALPLLSLRRNAPRTPPAELPTLRRRVPTKATPELPTLRPSRSTFSGKDPAAILLGIAGDSASGKDTLAASLARLLGEKDVLRLSGDDYHRWPRGHGAWRRLTHLDPRGSHLDRQLQHVVALGQQREVVKADYDHATGRFSAMRTVRPRPRLLVQGLHSFTLPAQRQAFDYRVYLAPDEALRLKWRLHRDPRERGISGPQVLALERRRAADRRKAILPQRRYADLLLSLRPAAAKAGALALDLQGRDAAALAALARELKALPGLRVTARRGGLSLRGEAPSAAQVQALALRLVAGGPGLLAERPIFDPGWTGLMSVAVLHGLVCARRRKMRDQAP